MKSAWSLMLTVAEVCIEIQSGVALEGPLGKNR